MIFCMGFVPRNAPYQTPNQFLTKLRACAKILIKVVFWVQNTLLDQY
jgi:hypothetical protein